MLCKATILLLLYPSTRSYYEPSHSWKKSHLRHGRTGEGGRKEQLRSPEDRPPYVMLTNPADPSPDA
ncbi:unnamed protein product [Sphenostylis stenocarpa]|uniref:Secreted protein n=1 Tax=Sphenostylis stenocarpa TaxID=92480 RepID=A0AA86SPQ5_9FABA|nr:unnamed protein product [Sphenostylis stenocarpa]